MTADTETPSPRLMRLHDDRSWYGWLCLENLDAVAMRLKRMLAGKAFTVVTANSYREDEERFSAFDVTTSQWLTEPVKQWSSDSPDSRHEGITWITPRTVFGLSTTAQTEADAREGGLLNKVYLNFDSYAELAIDQYAPAGYRLRWVFKVEDHTGLNEWEEFHR